MFLATPGPFFRKRQRISLIFETSVLGKTLVTVAATERKRRLNWNLR